MGSWREWWRRMKGRGGGAGGPVVEGFIGRRIVELERTHDFFRFFHFEQAGVEKRYEDGDEVVVYKPSGPDFRELVTLSSWVSRGVIRTIRLTVRRSFIESGATCMNAADLYNSFLRSVGEVTSGDAIDRFAHEITARSMARAGRVVILRGEAPRAEGAPSRAYRAYAGELEAENVVYGSLLLKLVARNGRDGKFEILVWPTDEEERDRARKERALAS